MPQHEMLTHFHAVYTPKEMVKATKSYVDSLLSHPEEKVRNKHFQRLQKTFFAHDNNIGDYMSFKMDDDGNIHCELTELGAAEILEQMGHLERADRAALEVHNAEEYVQEEDDEEEAHAPF